MESDSFFIEEVEVVAKEGFLRIPRFLVHETVSPPKQGDAII